MVEQRKGLRGALPPGRSGLPVLGETLNYLLDMDFIHKRQRQYGPVFKTHLFGHPTVVMLGPDANRYILAEQMQHFSWREGWPSSLQELLVGSLIVRDGPEHQRIRKTIAPAFHGRALAHYFETMERILLVYLDKWQALGSFAWFFQFKQMLFEIASELLLGAQPGKQTAYLSRLYNDVAKGVFMIPIRWRWTPFGRALIAREQIMAYLDQAIAIRQQTPAHDVLGMLVQLRDDQGDGLSLDEIKAQAMVLVGAAHETTTSFLVSMCLALAQNPAVLERARAEQRQLGGTLGLERLSQMPYLDQVLREVERRYPPTAGGFRGVVETFSFGGYTIPQCWRVYYSIADSHRDPQIYPEPERFDPERFSPGREEHKHQSFSLVTFGGGPRICLGMAFARMIAKLTAAHLLRSYSWAILSDQRLHMVGLPFLHPRDGLKVRFERLRELAVSA